MDRAISRARRRALIRAVARGVLRRPDVSLRTTLIASLAFASMAAGCDEGLSMPLSRSFQALHSAPVEAHPRLRLTPALRLAAARIQVSSERWSEHPSEIVAALDIHSDPGATDEAFDALRAEALLQGGDAVLGVEFHHDDVTGESWVTGSAVQFVPAPVTQEAPGPAAIPLLAADSLARPTEVIGALRVDVTPNDPSEGRDALRERASMLGADAVLGVATHPQGPGPSHITGLAVRFGDLVGGRNYTVLDRVAVPAQGVDDPAALDQLRARARIVGADLIVNIALAPSDAPGQPYQLVGDAVHVRVAPRD